MSIDEYVAALPADQAAVATALRSRIDAGLPDAEGRMWHGHPVWLRGDDPVAGFKAFPRWVTLLLWHGSEVTEATDALTASADGTRWSLKITAPDEVDESALDGWLTQLAR
ncbi:hypothetical protein Cch01nite_28430 [Cellulomonas chitinilytica]|uniref:YdhG-like domain-containing protein n=1 Tax=Cellulomonas chitinilytica TaxID=398759 RepID=A0A919U3G3_9CELL|nr:DUF1801 domain-containing protein [Cellulomonas chitinilytica]GIG22119.1 hypothetical protein Cch01nite_28430 [Cellulomonas chitinilytica]